MKFKIRKSVAARLLLQQNSTSILSEVHVSDISTWNGVQNSVRGMGGYGFARKADESIARQFAKSASIYLYLYLQLLRRVLAGFHAERPARNWLARPIRMRAVGWSLAVRMNCLITELNPNHQQAHSHHEP